ncbi:MAG: 16S rRNA (cytosine(967)-C(5))-methyltransferase RsmB [Gemmatimonadota bacterium]
MKPAADAGRAGDPARATALRLLQEAEGSEAPLEQLFGDLEAGPLGERDRRFVRQLVIGAVKFRARLDWVVGQFTSRPVAELEPAARQVLRLGAYQLLFLDRVPPRAAVHSSVELAKHFGHRGIAGLVNAVLRRVMTEGAGVAYPDRRAEEAAYLAVYYSHPVWQVERWLARWGSERTEALLRANNEPARLYIRLAPASGSRADLAAQLGLPGTELIADGPQPGTYEILDAGGVFDSPAFHQGWFYVQDANAGLPVALLDPQPGERVLDACSAPGGKAVQAAIAVGPAGRVAAADLSPPRLRRVADNLRRLRLDNLWLVAEDGARPGLATRCGSPLFDRVLVDAPCSGTGVYARRPEARWRRGPAGLARHAELQYRILRQAFARLRPGGVLVYSTCSLEEEENDAVVDRLLAEEPAAVLEPAGLRFPGAAWARRCVQTLPGREPGDGSFAARLRKVPA